ncbi:MAG: radical SAM protein, partial [Desulfovibrionales bacterium]|nr:radical SAM protein [Desulfovibrionales bacterium]
LLIKPDTEKPLKHGHTTHNQDSSETSVNTASHTLFRPPAEAGSVLVRVADGCPHNACAFCAMYSGVPYREYTTEELAVCIAEAAREYPYARRVFLADGDVLALPQKTLSAVLALLRASFPRLARVNCYASARAMMNKSEEDLLSLRQAGLHTLYLGLESGSEAVLKLMRKGTSALDMVKGCQRVQRAGLNISVMVLIGLGGQKHSAEHIDGTVQTLNAMQPQLLSCLRLVPVAGTLLARWIRAGHFVPLTEMEAVLELRAIIQGLELGQSVFRADHASNILPLAGRLPKDKDRLLAELDELLGCGVLDGAGPGIMPSLL